MNAVAIVKSEFDGSVASTGFCVLRPNSNKILSSFLFFFIRTPSFIDYLNNLATGASYPAVSDRIIKSCPLNLPPLPEQHRIVNLLDRAQELIDKRKKQLELMDSLVQSVFYEMFGDPVRNEMGWKIGIIGDLATKTQYGTGKKSESTGAFPVLRMNNITYKGGWDFSSLKYADFDEKECLKYLVHKGEMLFNRTNSKELVGKTAVYRLDKPVAYAGYLVKLISNKHSNTEFISAFLNSKYGKATLFKMAKSIVGMANINAEELKSIPIYIPPINLQNNFAERVYKIEAVKQSMTSSLRELEHNFNALMQQSFGA